MTNHNSSALSRPTRREFLCGSAAAASLLVAGRGVVRAAEAGGAEAGGTARRSLAFVGDGPQYAFDTGIVRGQLRSQGRSLGLMPLTHGSEEHPIAQGYGVCSHYRLLDAQHRYGQGAWDWPSRAKLREDGSVAVSWSPDDRHPLAMRAEYRWQAANVLDLATTLTAQRDLQRIEVFLASYFAGFPHSHVYVQSAADGKAGFVEAAEQEGVWQMFPRDAAAVEIIQDGRWQRPPNPVDWKIRPALAAPLAMRRDPDSGLTALLMAPPDDCFAVATPHSGEGHRSIYLSLLGVGLAAGESATARSRLVIQRGMSDQQAIACYQRYLREL